MFDNWCTRSGLVVKVHAFLLRGYVTLLECRFAWLPRESRPSIMYCTLNQVVPILGIVYWLDRGKIVGGRWGLIIAFPFLLALNLYFLWSNNCLYSFKFYQHPSKS